MAATRILPNEAHPRVSGSVHFRLDNGTSIELLTCSAEELQLIRRQGVAYIFQDPVAALNPHSTVGTQFRRLYALRGTKTDWKARSLEALERVRISGSQRVLESYPHELSGGMCQRVCIALALSGAPRLIIADEPTTDLDVVTRNAILDLIRELSDSLGMSILLVTHDMGIVRHYCRDMAVMSNGRIVESGPTRQVFQSPQAEYTQRLLQAVPRISSGEDGEDREDREDREE